MLKPPLLAALATVLLTRLAGASPAPEVVLSPAGDPQSFILAGPGGVAAVAVDPKDYPVVQLAAGFFAADVERVTGRRPAVTDRASTPQVVIAGTLGHSALVDQLVAGGRLQNAEEIRGHWEGTLAQTVEKPFPGVERALVIVGSDRRGTAYGLMRLSETIGVSPWSWWADVPVVHRDTLAIKLTTPRTDAPAVRYRGIFINDEDWGLNPWARETFDPGFHNIGPKTYEKIFELMLRLRLNYLWPAMHGCSQEFARTPENAALADRYAIVAGASHCEPMLYNNIHWDTKTRGPWNYDTNRDSVHTCWEESVKTRGGYEAVWTLGIRGVHDQAMQGPKELPARQALLSRVIDDERALLDQYATKQWGPVAQCFVPYKEVQPLYDAGLQVPPDVTLVWADDNFGYLRRLSSTAERQRPGGAGFYYHISYYGQPHSYTWINTTAPALMWEEMHKAWENDARTIWVLNVGDIKPMEIGVDYFARLAWNPEGFGPDCQPLFLRDFARRNFGEKVAQPLADFLAEFYRLGAIHKPELMDRAWATSLPDDEAAKLTNDYTALLAREKSLSALLPADARDAYTETVGFPARVLGNVGLIFMADRRKVLGGADAAGSDEQIARLRAELESEVANYNTHLAGGKWNHMMPGLVTGKPFGHWSSQVRWPWSDKPGNPAEPFTKPPDAHPLARKWRDAASAERRTAAGNVQWTTVPGLGPSGHAVSLQPTTLATSWPEGDANAPALEYAFEGSGDAEALIRFLPAFRLVPGMHSRVCVRLDNGPAQTFGVPGADGSEDENGKVRNAAVQDNFVQLRVPLPGLASGKHVLRISAVDPGVVIDRLSLP